MKYRDPSSGFEAFLGQLNAAAATIPEPTALATSLDSVQIVGLPRSGTTLLYQLLARTGAVGYPSNVMAFFHRAPWVGATLQQRLAANDPTLSLGSVAGRTSEPLDPHEFGYFWRRVCGHSSNNLTKDLEPLPPAKLQRELDLVAGVFDKPVVYKNFLALAHAHAMRRNLRRVRFIGVERDRFDAAASLLAVRHQLNVPDDQVFGTAPASFERTRPDPVSMVADQVTALSRLQVAGRFDSTSGSTTVRYADLMERPRDVIAGLLDWLGAESPRINTAVPRTLSPGAGASALSDDMRRELVTAIDRADRLDAPSAPDDE